MCVSLHRLHALKSTSVTCSEFHEIFDEGPKDLKLNQDYMSEMSKCNTGSAQEVTNPSCVICSVGCTTTGAEKCQEGWTPTCTRYWTIFYLLVVIRATNC